MAEEQSPPWWKREPVIAWALVLFPPVGLYLMWKFAPWRKRFKWTWTFTAPLIWLIVVSLPFAEEREESPVVAQVQPTSTLQSSQASSTPLIEATTRASPTPPTSSHEEEAREKSAAPLDDSALRGGPIAVAGQGLLSVYFFDVSLGDAIYIRTPGGEDIIIDGGDSPNELSAFLDAIGELEVDVVVASHPHADHIGGLPRVLRERAVGSVWTNGQTYTTNLYRELEAAIAGSGAERHVGTPGATFTVGGVSFSVLAPTKVGSNVNDNSLVLRMDCSESSFLFTGDAETSSENEMIVLGRELDVDILKLGHHGSRTSTSRQFILATTPKLAIYQADIGNQYGHPHRETLDRLAAVGVPVFGTGMTGETIVVSTACDDQFSIYPQFDGFGEIALASTPPASESTSAPAIEATAQTSAVAVAPTAVLTQPPAVQATQRPATTDCHPSYQGGTDRDRGGCIRAGIGDYDCWPGTGNGPNYVIGPVTVVGPDEYQLDTNDPDDIGCESS